MSKEKKDGVWPWCGACTSYHRPDNPTCALNRKMERDLGLLAGMTADQKLANIAALESSDLECLKGLLDSFGVKYDQGEKGRKNDSGKVRTFAFVGWFDGAVGRHFFYFDASGKFAGHGVWG